MNTSFTTIKNNIIDSKEVLDHNDLMNILSNPMIENDRNKVPLFYAFTMKSYPIKRDQINTSSFDTIILDYDGCEDSIREVLERFSKFKYYFYTTYNHLYNKKTEQHDINMNKFRIILPLDKEYSSTWFKHNIMKTIFSCTGIFKGADLEAAKITQYFIPAVRSDRKDYYKYRFNNGIDFSLDVFKPICDDIVSHNYRSSINSQIKLVKGDSYSVANSKKPRYFLDNSFPISGGDKPLYEAIVACVSANDLITLERVIQKAKCEKKQQAAL